MEIKVSDEVKKILDDYKVEVKRVTNNCIDKVAKESVNKLKSNSPKRSGSYAKGWTVKRERGSLGINKVTVHNKTDYQLTHLLENGHVIKNAKGEYGRAPAHKHIQPVEQWAIDELPMEIKRELE